jgi:predicted nucleotidyltransferase
MRNTLVQPLEIKHDNIDQGVLTVIRKVDEIARRCDTTYFLAGATAREIILRHVFGRPPGRRTLDVDFGIAVRDWEQFENLKSALIKNAGFEQDQKKKQRILHKSSSVKVDLIPFGGVERTDGTITWPPDEDIVMRVTGFTDALESAVMVRLDENLLIRVVSLPALLVLKVFAWVDRKYEKRDAEDIYTLLKQYGDAGNEDRLYGENQDILESEGFDFELAGARLIGRDVAQVILPETRRRIREVLESDQQMLELTNQVIVFSGRNDAQHVHRCEMLVTRMREGFLQAP